MLDVLKKEGLLRLGDAIRLAMTTYGWEEIGARFLLLGDPSLEYSLPRPAIELTRPRLDAAAGSVAFDYELPADLALPVGLDCMLISKDQTTLAQWREHCSENTGMIAHQVAGEVDLAQTHRIFTYTTQKDSGDFVGVVFVDKKETDKTAETVSVKEGEPENAGVAGGEAGRDP